MITYLLWAAGRLLISESIEELAEICECAIAAEDAVGCPCALDARGPRPLTDQEHVRLLELAFSRLSGV